MQADKTVAELLCQWYLRLNGYFTMPNFIAHGRPAPVTEVDVLGVRFRYSREMDFADHHMLKIPANEVDIVFAEATTGRCKLNGPWKQGGQALEYVLQRVGAFANDNLRGQAAKALVDTGRFENAEIMVRLLCFGGVKNGSLTQVTQILWPDVIAFIHDRFRGHEREKAEHQHWDDFGQCLWGTLTKPGLPALEDLIEGWKKRTQEIARACR